MLFTASPSVAAIFYAAMTGDSGGAWTTWEGVTII